MIHRSLCSGTAQAVQWLAAGERFEVLAKNPLNEKCQASMAVSHQSLFIREEKHLWCIGR